MSPVETSAIIECETRADAAEFTARRIADALLDDILTNGAATLLVSGGSTPKAMFALLSELDLPWDNVTIGLVDERSVPSDHAASNAGLAKNYLIKNKAAAAEFVPMFQELEAANEAYARLLPASMTLLGMGSDGHTASWFPGAVNLSDALGLTERTIVSIDARGCAVAGEVPERITLTRNAITTSRRAILMIFGDEKMRVLKEAKTKSVSAAPIRAAIEDLGDRLETVWAS